MNKYNIVNLTRECVKQKYNIAKQLVQHIGEGYFKDSVARDMRSYRQSIVYVYVCVFACLCVCVCVCVCVYCASAWLQKTVETNSINTRCAFRRFFVPSEPLPIQK